MNNYSIVDGVSSAAEGVGNIYNSLSSSTRRNPDQDAELV